MLYNSDSGNLFLMALIIEIEYSATNDGIELWLLSSKYFLNTVP